MLSSVPCFLLLGPFQICGGQMPVPLAGKPRSLLAALLLQPSKRVPNEYLIEVIWEAAPPRQPRASLYSYAMRARKALVRAGYKSSQLSATGDGYRLDVAAADVDVAIFDQRLASAADARKHADKQAELLALRAALDLWRGNALEDVASELLRNRWAHQLEEARLSALQRRIDLDLEDQRPDDVLPTLMRLTSAYPLREVFWRQLMLAQYYSERRAEALETYRRAATYLRGELGLDPSTELEDLHQDILNDRVEALPPPHPCPRELGRAPRSGAEGPGACDGLPVRCQLPRDVPDFVGRHRAFAVVRDAILPGPGAIAPGIVAVSGPPGIGKTALAVHAAHLLRGEFPDGQWYMRLNTFTATDVTTALGGILRSVGVPGQGLPALASDRAGMLRDILADRRVLLVLDQAADPVQLEFLLPGTPSCAVIVTSRCVMAALPGARHLRLGPLTDQQASSLLRAIIGNRRYDEQPDAARRLTRFCEGNPMMIRDVSAYLLIHEDVTLAWLSDAIAESPENIITLIGEQALRYVRWRGE